MVKISIIVPNYNHAEYLEKRLDSIFNQSYSDFEVILLDDASNDNSHSFLDRFNSHPKVSQIVINKKNSGSPFKQWFKGLQLAKGEYIWIAESDDFADLNFLETQIKYLEEADVSVAKTIAVEGSIIRDIEIEHPVFRKAGDVKLSSSDFDKCPITNISAVLFKKPTNGQLQTFQFHTYDIVGDYMFYYEYFLLKKIVYNDSAKSFFRQKADGTSNLSAKSMSYFKNYFYEHVKFIDYLKLDQNSLGRAQYRNFIRRIYRKVRNRGSFYDKLSMPYIKIYFLYKLKSI